VQHLLTVCGGPKTRGCHATPANRRRERDRVAYLPGQGIEKRREPDVVRQPSHEDAIEVPKAALRALLEGAACN
jgi:hypothetical protein